MNMINKYISNACAAIALIGIFLTSGCRSDNSERLSSSANAGAALGTEETLKTEEQAYSAELALTLTFPDKTEYTSTDNGVTWVTSGKTVYYNEMPAYLTVICQTPVSISGGIPITMTIHNHNNKTDVLGGGSYVEVSRLEDGEWIGAEYADKSVDYAYTQQMDLIYSSKDYYIDLSVYEPLSGRYRLTKEFSIEGDEMLGLTSPSVPGGIYVMSAEFNALA